MTLRAPKPTIQPRAIANVMFVSEVFPRQNE